MREAPTSNVPLHKIPRHELIKRDVFGRTILHVAILCNNPEAFRKLLRNPDLKHVLSATDYESGWNVLHYIFFHKRLRCLTVLLEHLEQATSASSAVLANLLKAKDRSRQYPLVLLQNDVKDLVWIPQYVNEKDEFHLVSRFPIKTEAEDARKSLVPRYIEHDWWSDQRGGSEVYVFGANSNNHLGVGDSTDRKLPSRLSLHEFKLEVDESSSLTDMLQRPRFKQIEFSKYHSAVLTLDGQLFTCGIGSRGRLGHGNSGNTFKFKRVAYFGAEPIKKVALSNNHTLALTESNKVFAWGLNEFNQLGLTSVATANSFKSTNELFEVTPKEVNSGDMRKLTAPILGLEASKIHSVAYTKHSVYFWGLEIGQMGLVSHQKSIDHRVNGISYKGSLVSQPKEVSFRDEIKTLATCETCTCIVTETNDIYVYYMGQRVKLPKLPSRVESDANFDLFKPSRLTSAPVIKKVSMKSHETVHVLLQSGDVMSFSILSDDLKHLRSMKFTYAWRAYDSDMRVVDIDNSYDGSLIVCTKNGSVFRRSNQSGTQRRGSVATATVPTFASSTKNKFTKLENVNRVVRVTCDDNFTSFGLIRDDVDSLPFKLQKNDIIKDLEYLSPLSEPDLYRKQDQLLDVDHDINAYVTDFLYPVDHSPEEESHVLLKTRQDAEDEDFSESVDDLLKKESLKKYIFGQNVKPTPDVVFQQLTEREIEEHNSLLRSIITKPSLMGEGKFCDGRITFSKIPDLTFSFHTDLFQHRSKFCRALFNPKEDGEYFVHEGLEGSYIASTKTLNFKSDIEPTAVLVLLHFMYTNRVLNFWDRYAGGLKPESIKSAKSQFSKLMNLFKLDSFYGKDVEFMRQIQQISENTSDGDVLISLDGGERVCWSSILVATSAFFETILSGRWETGVLENDDSEFETKFVSLESVTPLQFDIILKHLHGCNDLDVFEEARTVMESNDTDDFVNFLLDMVSVADELLLVKLKHLCELAIKHFISLDNVLILLGHADWLNARKLFMCCCWYIYNNLEIVVFDGYLGDLDPELLRRVESQIAFFDKCKHFDFVVGDRGETNCLLLEDLATYNGGTLFDEFRNDLAVYNEHFMSDRKGFSSFEPLLDFKGDAVNEDGRRKLSARRMSRKSSIDPLVEFRKLAISTPQQERKGSDSAVADEEEFELVVSRKRKSKSTTERASVATAQDRSMGPTQLTPVPIDTSTGTRSVSLGILNGSSTVTEGASVLWSSRNGSTSSIATQAAPVLGHTLETSAKPTKIKFAPSMKLSQKQRRKLAQGNSEGSSSGQATPQNAPTLKNPWGAVETSTPPESSLLQSLPVLGQKPAVQPQPQPTLSAIMLQEATKVEDRQNQVTKTLQEIQQEQEFAKWWEEESRRVLMEMNGHSRDPAQRGGRGRRGKKRGGRTPST